MATDPSHPAPDWSSTPTDYVVTLLPSRQAGEAARQALQSAGFAAADVVLYNGQEGLHSIQASENPLTQITEAVDKFTEEGIPGRELYMDGLAKGQTLLMVYAPDDATIYRAQEVLRSQGAQKMAAFRPFAIEDL